MDKIVNGLVMFAYGIPAYAIFFGFAFFYRKKQQGGKNCTVPVRGVIANVKRVRKKGSDIYLPIYRYEYMGVVYDKTSPIAVAYTDINNKIGTILELYIDPSNPEKYFCPADTKMLRIIEITFWVIGAVITVFMLVMGIAIG